VLRNQWLQRSMVRFLYDSWAFCFLRECCAAASGLHKSSAVAEMGDRLATIDMGRKMLCPFPWGSCMGPRLTKCRLIRGLPPYQVYPDLSSRLATIDVGQKVRWVLCPFLLGSLVPSNILWPGPRPSCSYLRTISGILIRPTVWPYYSNVTDWQDRQDNVTVA